MGRARHGQGPTWAGPDMGRARDEQGPTWVGGAGARHGPRSTSGPSGTTPRLLARIGRRRRRSAPWSRRTVTGTGRLRWPEPRWRAGPPGWPWPWSKRASCCARRVSRHPSCFSPNHRSMPSERRWHGTWCPRCTPGAGSGRLPRRLPRPRAVAHRSETGSACTSRSIPACTGSVPTPPPRCPWPIWSAPRRPWPSRGCGRTWLWPTARPKRTLPSPGDNWSASTPAWSSWQPPAIGRP